MSGWVWAVLAILILLNALYVAAEFSAVGVRKSRIRRLSDDGNWLARRILPFLDDPAALDRYVGTSQIGITVSSILLGAFAQATVSLAFAPVLGGWFGLEDLAALSIAAAVVLVALTAAQLVLGELLPKAVALHYSTTTALVTVLPMRWSLFVFRPIIWLLNGASILLLRLVGVGEQTHRHLHSPEEIDLMIAESRDGGLLEPEEQNRLRRALHLGTLTARQLMVPRDRLTMLSLRLPWDEVVRTVAASPYSRLPVYRDDPDRIVGMLRVKDLVNRYAAEGPTSLEQLIRPVMQIDDTLAADRAIAELREHRAHSAIVVDGSGRAAGLITMQDRLGELLGAGAGAPAASGAR
jgi:CBS domain containing-hemolysin-like protein